MNERRDGHELIAQGRDSDIYAYAPGLVLRRARSGRSMAHEARIMQYATEHGFPVPRIEAVQANGCEIVMERVDGPSLLDVMARRPWKGGDSLRVLADLHDRLHRIAAPDWLPRLGADGDRLLHLDLHPANVLMSARGPVVIDWPNACAGEPLADVALTYALLLCPRIPAPAPARQMLQLLRKPLVERAFARRYRGMPFRRQVAAMASLKSLDRNMAPDEVRSLQALARSMEQRTEPGGRATG